uniref:PRKG1_interact domain-containing protein n=1 Tax=Macrostomum lignano TaxID=282301 RepID=A0A1I8FKP1_9PLAT
MVVSQKRTSNRSNSNQCLLLEAASLHSSQSKRKLPNMEALAAQQEEWQKKRSGVPGSTLTRIEAESRRAANATVRREKLTEKELIRQEVELELQAKFQEALAVKEAENESLRAETDSLKRSLANSTKVLDSELEKEKTKSPSTASGSATGQAEVQCRSLKCTG